MRAWGGICSTWVFLFFSAEQLDFFLFFQCLSPDHFRFPKIKVRIPSPTPLLSCSHSRIVRVLCLDSSALSFISFFSGSVSHLLSQQKLQPQRFLWTPTNENPDCKVSSLNTSSDPWTLSAQVAGSESLYLVWWLGENKSSPFYSPARTVCSGEMRESQGVDHLLEYLKREKPERIFRNNSKRRAFSIDPQYF